VSFERPDDHVEAKIKLFAIRDDKWSAAALTEYASMEEVFELAAKARVHAAVVAGRWQREHGDFRRFSKLLGRGEVRSKFGS
jgi:HTH-type transcriptional regulator/antitoxin HigA